MATIKPLERGEMREIPSKAKSTLSPEERSFAEVFVEWMSGPPMLQMVFGNLYYELPDALARDFGARIARAMTTSFPKGSRRGFRCMPGLTRQERDTVEVFMHDNFERKWLRLEFADGNTVDFSVLGGKDFAERIARAVKSLPPAEKLAA